jgi:hypothetical protein
LRIFRGIGTYPVFFEQLHGFIFGESAAIAENGGLHYLPAAGGGLRFNTSLIENIPLTFSLEYQRGLKPADGGRGQVLLLVLFQGLELF